MKKAAKTKASKESQSTRDMILEAAIDLFSEQGYVGTSMRHLASTVGIRESSIYNHFDGKSGILSAIVREMGPGSAASRLDQDRYYSLSKQPVEFCRLYVSERIAQWADPRERKFQRILSIERNRIPGLRASFADQLFSREQKRLETYFHGSSKANLITSVDPAEAASRERYRSSFRCPPMDGALHDDLLVSALSCITQ